MTYPIHMREAELRGIELGENPGFERSFEKGFERSFERGFEIGFNRGFEIGFKRGLAKGEKLGVARVAKEMLLKGISADDVSELTRLPLPEVLALAREIQP